jgi:hypothetical protein
VWSEARTGKFGGGSHRLEEAAGASPQGEGLRPAQAKGGAPPKIWICDIGAMNYMWGSRVAFTEPDTTVCGTVQFNDDSMAQIEGSDSVLFICKNDEHQMFVGVYHIPRLMANIVIVGQLNDSG